MNHNFEGKDLSLKLLPFYEFLRSIFAVFFYSELTYRSEEHGNLEVQKREQEEKQTI